MTKKELVAKLNDLEWDITAIDIATLIYASESTINRTFKELLKENVIKREGFRKTEF